jgi:hypothetical protein
MRQAPAKRGSWWSVLPTVISIAVVGGFVYKMVQQDNERVREQQQANQAEQNAREAVFGRGDLAETLALCREGWKNASFYQDPIAIAWTRRGIDAYFWQGTDGTSVRQVRCDGQGVRLGPRVDHPLQEKLPAEAVKEVDERVGAAWSAAISRAAARKFGPGDVAFELLLHPFTGAVLSRRWSGGPEGATATLDPKDAPPFAFLPAEAFPAVGKAPVAIRPRERRRWLAQDGAAFSLLWKELPKGARVSELTLDEDKIDVTIAWQTPAFDGKPPVPYGQKTFDEYGVADAGFWYPREIPGFGCAKGEPLSDVITAFGIAKAQRGSMALTGAWYSCSTAYSNGRSGVWHLTPTRN